MITITLHYNKWVIAGNTKMLMNLQLPYMITPVNCWRYHTGPCYKVSSQVAATYLRIYRQTHKWKGNRRLQTCQNLDNNHIESLSDTRKWLETKSMKGGMTIGDVNVDIENFNLNGILFP